MRPFGMTFVLRFSANEAKIFYKNGDNSPALQKNIFKLCYMNYLEYLD